MDGALNPFELVINTYSVTAESHSPDKVLVRDYYVRVLRNARLNWIMPLLLIEKDSLFMTNNEEKQRKE